MPGPYVSSVEAGPEATIASPVHRQCAGHDKRSGVWATVAFIGAARMGNRREVITQVAARLIVEPMFAEA